MEIKVGFKIDEAKVLRLVMQGLNKDEIEKELAREVIEYTKQRIRERVACVLEENNRHNLEEGFITAIQKKVAKLFTPKFLIKQFKAKEWSKLMERAVEPTMVNFIEHALGEWLCLELSVSGRDGKKKTVPVCGIDSYTHRKK